MPSPLPAAVLFDMDGTLVDTEGLWLEAEMQVMSGLGAVWTEDDQAHCLGGPLERVAQYMLDRSGAEGDTDGVGLLLLDAMEGRLRASPLQWRPGARSLLLECRDLGIPTALVSASWTRLIEAVSEKIHEDLGQRAFDAVVAGDDVANSKPHPEPYQTAASALGVIPDETLALEDSPTGVRSAVDAGCRVIAIPHISTIDVDGAVLVETIEGRCLADLWRLATAQAPRDLARPGGGD